MQSKIDGDDENEGSHLNDQLKIPGMSETPLQRVPSAKSNVSRKSHRKSTSTKHKSNHRVSKNDEPREKIVNKTEFAFGKAID